jgi:hypothetical protein
MFCAAVLLTGFAAPDDETWIRITGFSDPGTVSDSTTTTTSGTRSVIESDLQDGKTDTVDVHVQNTAVILGASGNGVSITVHNAKVEYFVQNQSLPTYQYAVTLFLPPPTSGEAGSASSEAVLQNLPVVPAALKAWILNPANFPAEIAAAGFIGEARITLRARTEEGRELETSSGIAVVFN